MIVGEKCVVVLSGRADSSTVAYWAKNQEYDVYAIAFKYGQIAVKETESAKQIAETIKIPIKVVDLSNLRDIYIGVTSLCDETIEMTSSFSQPIIVPFRNGIFLSVSVAYAISIGATKIFYGAHGSDEPFYPDCRENFYKAFELASRLGTDQKISIRAPYSSIRKSAIIEEGAKLGVPFDLTWSCYFDKEKHCGKCESCINRKKAFGKAGIKDPTEYLY